MKQIVLVVLYQSLTFLLQLTFLFTAARSLGPELQGKYAVLRTCSYLIEAFMWLGLTSGVTYLVAKDFERYHNSLIIAASVYLTCGIACGIPAIIYGLPYFHVSPATGFLVLVWVVSLASSQLFLKIFLAQQRYDVFNYVSVATGVALCIAFAGFWVASRITLSTVICCNVLGNLAGTAVSLAAHRRHLVRLDFAVLPIGSVVVEFYSVGLKGYLSSIAFQLLYRVDFLFVGYFLGARTLGIYSLAVFVVEGVQRVPDWLGSVLTPKVSAGLDRDGTMTRSLAAGAAGFVAVAGMVVVFARLWHLPYLTYMLGARFQGVEAIVLALLPKGIIHAVFVIYAANLSGKGYTFYHPLSGVVSVATLIVLDSFLFHYLAISAAIIGITGAYVVAAAIMIYGAHRSSERSIAAGLLVRA
jgi:O-antigen/teichoic acid export membrane protein